MLRRFKIPVIVLATVLLNQAAGYAVHASMPDALRPAGTTRYAVAQSTDNVTLTSGDPWSDLPGVATSISIPSGKRGDVMIVFCAEAEGNDAGLHARAHIGGALAVPDQTLLQNVEPKASQCTLFYKANVRAGTRMVKIQWMPAGGAVGVSTVGIRDRSMFVTINIHE